MPYIEVISDDSATGELKAIYDGLTETRGKVANIMKIQSLNPRAMQTHLDLYLAIMFGRSKLKRSERELVAVVVSAANGCDYCVNHHSEALAHYWKDGERVARAARDPKTADLSDRELAMLGYATKLTRAPADVTEDDVAALRAQGFDDKDILDINLITSYFNFVNRIALGLGVEFSAEEVAGYEY